MPKDTSKPTLATPKSANSSKATPNSSKSRKLAQSPESPTPRSRKQPKPKLVYLREELWRESELDPDQKINATSANELYRINPVKYELEMVEKVSRKIMCRDKETGEMILEDSFTHFYREMDVERAAWKKAGDPNAFVAYLKKLKERWDRSHPGSIPTFPMPMIYKHLVYGVSSDPAPASASKASSSDS